MKEFAARRKILANKMQPNSIAIVLGSKQQYRNADTEYKFKQNGDFYYLTGIQDPSVIMVLVKNNDESVNYIIFTNPLTKAEELWLGERINLKTARSIFGADEAFALTELDTKLLALIRQKEHIYHAFGICKEFDLKLSHWLNSDPRICGRAKSYVANTIIDLRTIVHEMRIIKSKEEIATMKKAASISAKAHNELMKICKPGSKEYQLEAAFLYHTMVNGCQDTAYPSIVGGGNNGCILHYHQNNQELKNKDLVLVDAGGEYNYYAADITRTFPVSGKFSPEQRDLYQIVLKAQLSGISKVKHGNPFNSIQEAIVTEIINGLIDLKLIKVSASEAQEKELYKDFYPHSSGHWLGLDVHDAGSYKIMDKWKNLEEGMVLTIEPGIYIDQNNTKVPKNFRGIGIRIEDDILVTSNGCDVLSKEALKKISEIEAMMSC